MSSLEIAKLTGKDHAHLMRDIRNMEAGWEKISQTKFGLATYNDAQGKPRPCYELTKTECLYVATKFNDEARAKLVLRWEELEQKQRAQMLQLPDFTDPAEAAMAWAKEYREKKVLAIENKKLADMGIQYSINGQWILYAKYKDCGYVSSRSIDITRADGRPDVVLHTEWTQAGRKFLYEQLSGCGILPMLERG